MSDIMGAGDVVPWEGGCLLIGRALNVTPMHAHHAIQIGSGAERGIRFRTDERSEWTEYDAAIIPSRQPHTMDATRVLSNAIIFVEPESHEGRALAERYLGSGIASLDEEPFRSAAATLFSTWRGCENAAATASAARETIDALAQGATSSAVSDERILRAVAYIKSHLDRPLTLEQVADEACLSPSRFRHLFVEQTGLRCVPVSCGAVSSSRGRS